MRGTCHEGRGSRSWRAAAAAVLVAAATLLTAQATTRGLAVVSATKSLEELPNNKGKRYAICIGINNYEDSGIQQLGKARNDAKALGDAFKAEGQFDSVYVMTDDVDPRYDKAGAYPRLANIRARFTYLADFITPNDLVVFFFAGHGVSDDKGESYLVPADARVQDAFGTSLPVSEITAWLQKLKVKKSLLILDACREKFTQASTRGLSTTNSLHAEKFERAEVAAVFYATKTGWLSNEDPETDHGVFTRFLLEGIKGKADYQYGNRDGVVTFKELSGFVEDAVSAYALAHDMKQCPSTQFTSESFGDLAISTYSGSIDTATRSEVGPKNEQPSGEGSARIYSNVAGEMMLDGKPSGSIGEGETVDIDELPAGPHFLQIDHAYGVMKKELDIEDQKVTSVANIVVQNDREPKTVRGVTLVQIPGREGQPGFWLSDSEVTFGQFAEFVRRTKYEARGTWEQYYKPAYERYPVFDVTVDDCLAYAKWLSKESGSTVTLPTLDQWQWAASERHGNPYPWGKPWSSMYCQNADSTARGAMPVDGRKGPVQAQTFAMDITSDGVTHMAGNVREWCADQKKDSEGNPMSAVAGGSWRMSKPKYFVSDYFSWKPASAQEDDIGFRVAISGD